MIRIKYSIIALIVLCTNSSFAQTGLGYPEWPLIQRHSNNVLTSTIKNQFVNWKPTFTIEPYSNATQSVVTGSQTSTDFGPTGVAYDNCGNMKFYLNHTGTFLPTAGAGLKVVTPAGTELTSSANRMNCSPMDNEVQIFLMSGFTNRWMIIYNNNFDPASGTLGKNRLLQVMYSIVTYDGTTFSYVTISGTLQKDIVLHTTAYYYDYGKALSIEYEVTIEQSTEKRRYLYLKRDGQIPYTGNQNPATISTIQYDQYTINGNGIVLSAGLPVVRSKSIARGFSSGEDFGTPIELNETNGEIRLATMLCYNGTAGNTSSVGSRVLYAKYNDHTQFNLSTLELIHCSDLAVIPSDNTGDTYVAYHVGNWGGTYRATKNFINATRALNAFLNNFHRGLYHLEFSPNGRFVYVTGGGYSTASFSNMTFIGQIDLNQRVTVNSTSQYTLRIKTQEVATMTLGANDYTYYGKGKTYTGITHADYIAWKGVNVLEKAPNAKLYFTKLNSRSLFALTTPDEVFTNIDFLPQNQYNGASENVTLLNDPVHSTNNIIAEMLPDACDQQNYMAEQASCNPIIPCTNCIGSFAPSADNTTKYQISTWVHDANYTPTVYNFTDPKIYIDYTSTTGVVTSAGPFTASGLIIDSWQKLEGEFTIPTNTASIEIRLECTTGDCYFDDLRIFPYDGSMKTYVYDPVTLRLAAELDERNFGTFYEYDEEGKLMRIKKETEKGIMTIQESKTAVKKQ